MDHRSHNNKYYLTLIAALLAMLGPFSIDAYLPSFPAIESSFGVSRAVLSQSMGAYLFAFSFSTLFWGPLSDRIGRKTVILSSLLLYVMASVGCALSSEINTFLVFRVLQGLAASGGFITGRAMVRDANDAKTAHQAMSHVMLLFALAPAIAPVLGAWLFNAFGWQSVFWSLMGFGGLLILLVTFMKETLADEHRQSFHPLSVTSIYIQTLINKRFMGMVLSQSFAFAGLFLYISGAPTIIYDFIGLGSNDFGKLFIPMVAGMMLGSIVSGRLAHHYSSKGVVMLGFVILVLSVFFNLLQVTLLATTIFNVIGPLVLYSFGLSLMMPAIGIMSLDCFPKNRGAAASMQGFFQMLLSAVVASIAVPLLHNKLQYFVLGQMSFLLIALMLWFFVRKLRLETQIT